MHFQDLWQLISLRCCSIAYTAGRNSYCPPVCYELHQCSQVSQRLRLGIMVQLAQAFDGSTSCLHHSRKTEAHVRSCLVQCMSCQTWLAAKLERCIFTFSNRYNGYDDDDVEMMFLFLPWPPTSSVISIILVVILLLLCFIFVAVISKSCKLRVAVCFINLKVTGSYRKRAFWTIKPLYSLAQATSLQVETAETVY